MKHILSVALIVVFAACSVPTLVARSGEPGGRESEPVPGRSVVAQQIPVQGSAAADSVLKASAQPGRTADVQISNAIGAMAHRNGIIWADYSTDQMWAACPIWGAQDVTV